MEIDRAPRDGVQRERDMLYLDGAERVKKFAALDLPHSDLPSLVGFSASDRERQKEDSRE